MIIYLGLLYVLVSSIYTFSFAAASWKDNNKLASIGAIFFVFVSFAMAGYVAFRP